MDLGEVKGHSYPLEKKVVKCIRTTLRIEKGGFTQRIPDLVYAENNMSLPKITRKQSPALCVRNRPHDDKKRDNISATNL